MKNMLVTGPSIEQAKQTGKEHFLPHSDNEYKIAVHSHFKIKAYI